MIAEERNCQNCKSEFVIEPEDFQFYERVKVPPPTWCPSCRLRRRLVFWNEKNLFRKKEAIKGETIFSSFPDSSNIKIYERDYWWSDAWDPMDYGREYDFSKTFFEQFKTLSRDVPWASRSVQVLENSDYCDQASRAKNCYLCFDFGDSENCMYGNMGRYLKECMEFSDVQSNELCYENYNTGNCFQARFAVDSYNLSNCWFMKDCSDCNDCFGCVGLRHKKYHIFNQPYDKESYAKKIKEFNTSSYAAFQKIRKTVLDFWLKYPNKYAHVQRNERSEGEYLYNCKNVNESYLIIDSAENVKYSQISSDRVKDCMDYTNWGINAELIYESISCGENVSNLKFCFDCWPSSSNLEYCIGCHSSNNLFGCVSLRKKQFCIFNKQYSEQEYYKLRDKIIASMNSLPYKDALGKTYRYGEFLPPETSPLAYNESCAVEYMPLTEEQSLSQGFGWREIEEREYEPTTSSSALPDSIEDATSAIVKEIISCEGCARVYRILEKELEFYKRFGLPIPRLCPKCRHSERDKFRTPIGLWPRKCQCSGVGSLNSVYKNQVVHVHGSEKCQIEFRTPYAPDRPEIVYCEQCYNAEVV